MAIDRTKVLETAQKYLAKGNYDKAIAEYQRLVEADPEDVRTWLKIGDLYTRKGANEPACQTYLRVAEFYAAQGFFLKAVAVFKQILKLDASRLEISLRLAEMYEELQLVSDALSTYEQIANGFATRGDIGGALRSLARMVELDPENIPIRIKYAEALSKAGRADEAASEFQAGAALLRGQERIDDFLKVAERLLYHRPKDYDTARELAAVYLDRKDPKRALSKLQVCFKADPSNIPTLELLARAFHVLGQTAKTISVYREMARIHHEAGRRDARAAVLARILELDPNETDARLALAAYGPRSAPRPIGEPPRSAVVEPSRAEDTGSQADSSPPETIPPEELSENEIYILGDDGEELDVPASEAPLSGPPESALPPKRPSTADWDTGSIPPDIAREARIARLLTECEVFQRYGLHNKVRDQLAQVLEFDPGHIEANERLARLYRETGQPELAVARLLMLASALELQDPDRAAGYLNQALEIDPEHEEANLRLGRGSATDPPREEEEVDEVLFIDDAEEDLEVVEIEEDEFIAIDDPDEHVDTHQRNAPTGSRGSPSARTKPLSDPIEIVTHEENLQEGLLNEATTDQHDISGLMPLDAPPSDLPDPFAMPGSSLEPEYPLANESADVVYGSSQRSFHREDVARASGSFGIEEVLDEADFFLSQGLVDEARTAIEAALTRYPDHPLLRDKLTELDNADVGGTARTSAPPEPDRAFEFAEKLAEELGPREEPSNPGGDAIDVETVFAQFKKGVAAQISADDSETHFDLGIAYKEMGLLDDAIQEFRTAMSKPPRECSAHTMIGLCLIEQRKVADAIGHFKKGLYAEHKTSAEELGLYYELGQAYELLNDPREALYYYQKVYKRTPTFRNVTQRVQVLSTSLANSQAAVTPSPDDIDRAFDDLINDEPVSTFSPDAPAPHPRGRVPPR